MTSSRGEGSSRDRRRDPLRPLAVIDRLDVGPVELKDDRVTTPYVVTRGGTTDRIDLVYRYEEPVFDPSREEDRNLAAMIGAQLALNYGLFCREIRLNGPYDRADRRFLFEYAAHTAREIYVKKFLEPNPFLTGPASELPALRLETYLRANLRYEPDEDGEEVRWPSWDVAPTRCCVLSSGGKDSLLSFGLMRELGHELHPIFLNESGRHWFTALNAHRTFAREIPNTCRVWTSSDRVFAWMLRHLPFVREDFARVRADEYPIRLWTVAVFLFGALPLLRKRGLGRLVIGNEFDTTVRLSHKGITHYGGLFDQSRWFDNAMTRYFRRKRWGVSQFSVLRPLSELLIQKTLVERYPDLQRLQVSCHAAHIDGNLVRPCGQCEKCRRIVGMLEALGADPRHCGYEEAQIRECLASLQEKGVHQEGPGASHLFSMLAGQGLVPAGAGKSYPEIMRLRFDGERSPYETVPSDIRAPLYRTLLQHAEGAVERRGRSWHPCDPLSPEALTRPYLFEAARERPTSPRPTAPEDRVRFGELTWPEAERRFSRVDVALLPVGAVEQHGPHLPLDTDAYDAARLAEDVAGACSQPRPIVLPLIPYGVSYHHDDFPGTISVGPDTLSRLIYEIGQSLARNGVTKLVIVNGHGGNGPALHFAAQLINRDFRMFTCVDSGETSDADIEVMTETHNDAHAGEIETSTSLALRPELVQMERAEACVPRFSNQFLDFSSKRGVGWYAYTARISSSGVLGDPTKANAEKGERMWKMMVDNLVELVEDLKSMTLDEIHQRRY
ncbi:MAG: mycofactocin biosynthesis peptidyl-dipeptidase MftE [Acidobacteriota bacterium]|nr:mycofactocin biosynthesis peptidyl-dipeptidase MftE [Acidobacteriota bacterium]